MRSTWYKRWQQLGLTLGVWSLCQTMTWAALPLNSLPKLVILDGERGQKVEGGGAWRSDEFRGYVTILFYVDPDESEMNNAATEALKAEGFPPDQVRSVAVINMDATWLPNTLIQGKLEEKQKEYPNTLYVMDYKKVLVQEWGLEDHSSDVVILDQEGKVRFSVDGQLNEEQIRAMVNAVQGALR